MNTRKIANIKNFNRQNVYIQRTLLNHISQLGELKLLTLFLKLKREYRSGHFHSFDKKPSWYPGSNQSFRRFVNKMIQLGWVEKSKKYGSGFNLRSLKHLYELYQKDIEIKDHDYCIKAHGFDNLDFQSLFLSLQKEVITSNYKKQIYNITQAETTLQNIRCEKIKKTIFKLFLKRNLNNVERLAQLHRGNKTNLSSKGLGKLFGKSSAYGQLLFKQLIDEQFLTRQIENKFVNSNVMKLEHYKNTRSNCTAFIVNNKIYRKNTSIIINSFIKEKDLA